ncbi:GTP pyrophosphokinase family protein [Bacillus sp. BGMRC 2118]|nr:GTP pyrophosphokinase family protein [Bacillus sp. BGMRC 2118]
MMTYKFAIDEFTTKMNILNEEFKYIHDYNPIETISSRVKSPDSIIQKVKRKNINMSVDAIKANIKDIAGVRITCSFISDVYKVSELLEKQRDIEIVEYKDYIRQSKPNGYQSLHLIIKIPVFLSDRVEHTFVEIQLRTKAMDFWASLEHKIYYKFDKEIPERLTTELQEAAFSAIEFDKKMQRLHEEVKIIKNLEPDNHVLSGDLSRLIGSLALEE